MSNGEARRAEILPVVTGVDGGYIIEDQQKKKLRWPACTCVCIDGMDPIHGYSCPGTEYRVIYVYVHIPTVVTHTTSM